MYFSLPIPLNSIEKKTSNCNDIDNYFRIQNYSTYVDLKSEISEVSEHFNYFRVNLKDIQF